MTDSRDESSRLAAELADLPDDAFRQKYDLSVRDADVVGSSPTVPTREIPGQGGPPGRPSGLGTVSLARPSRAAIK